MLYDGKTIQVAVDESFIATMTFNANNQSVNKFDLDTTEELRTSLKILTSKLDLKGLLIESKKDTFIVGADITQFHEMFKSDDQVIQEAVINFNQIFCELEDLPFPTVVMIDGVCLGGGFELALACDYRVITNNARMGLPEVKLGINPGFGGTVRLPRLIGCDNAIEWIASGKDYKAVNALAVGAVDAIVEKNQLREAGLHLIEQAQQGKLDYKARRKEKNSPVKLNDMEHLMAFTTAKGLVASQAGPNMPAPVTAVKSIEQSSKLERSEAIKIEAKFFARLAKTEVANNLISLFLYDQDLSKRTNSLSSKVDSLQNLAVVGAGIMGGGIAYQAVYKGKHVVMKDIAQAGIDQGMAEASKLLAKQVDQGRLSAAEMAAILSRITPTLYFPEFINTEIVIEAVVENLAVKQAVLHEVEEQVKDETVIVSNTSTLSITKMAEKLKRQENFCGMHFFNPVHKMPLVEVIRGKKTSDSTIAKVVKLAKDMGKTPIIVNDCAGFYVNRVLFPYLAGFNFLVRDGADFQHVDKVMERFGWPMGPAYLIDVVGIDTACHAASVMAGAYPARMGGDQSSPVRLLHSQERYGQKNNKGFYRYENDKKGKPKKIIDESVYALIKPSVAGNQTFTDEEIIERMMLPMCFEVVRCLDENIVTNPIDAEIGLLMGVGFPVFRGGALRYMESIGLNKFLELAQKHQRLGELYRAPLSLINMAQEGRSFFDKKEIAQ